MSYSLPQQSHRIPYGEAERMIERYQLNMDNILKPELVDSKILPISETFNKEPIIEYLQRSDVSAFRIYYGMSPNLEIHAIIVGVDSNGNDIVPKPGNGNPGDPEPDPAEFFEDAQRCPSACPPTGGCFDFRNHPHHPHHPHHP